MSPLEFAIEAGKALGVGGLVLTAWLFYIIGSFTGQREWEIPWYRKPMWAVGVTACLMGAYLYLEMISVIQ